MEQSSNDVNALLMDAQQLLKKEECVLDTGQRSSVNDAVAKDVQTKL